jgi:glycosyltransferase involved in cell wall biosynthesis
MSRHAQEEPGLPKAYIDELKRIEAACYQHTSHFITVDTGQRTILTEAGVEGHRITIIPNAVDVSGLQAAAAHGRRIDDSAYFILPRRLVPKNGPIIALEAFLEWVGERDVKLLVAGDGPLLERMKSICLNHAEGRKVIFAGMVPTADMPPLVANALAALVPSVPYQGVIEATSIAALEALALNVPVIASDIGGLSEIDRGTGIVTLVPANCGPALKAEMERTYNQRSAPRGTHRETHVRKNFGAERWIESHLEIYESTLTE